MPATAAGLKTYMGALHATVFTVTCIEHPGPAAYFAGLGRRHKAAL